MFWAFFGAFGVVMAVPPYVSRLDAAINAQHFNLTVTAGGAIEIIARDTGEHLTTITSAFSSPGPVWNEFNLSATVGSWKVSYGTIHPSAICVRNISEIQYYFDGIIV